MLLLVFVMGTVNAYGKVGELRGRWDIVATNESGENHIDFKFFINDLKQNPQKPEELLGAGCMQTSETELMAPLSLVAKANEDGFEIIKLLSTALVKV